MSGPIVRTGATPEFWENWDRIFGDKGSTGTKKSSSKKAAKKTEAKPAKAAKKTETAPQAKKKAAKKKK